MATENERRIINKLKQIIAKADKMAVTHSPSEQLSHYSGSLKLLISEIEADALQYDFRVN